MMALSLLNITPASPAAPAAPPGSAIVVGAFDLLLPVADLTDPRHEPALDGKEIGKDMPVVATEIPNPLTWLVPPITPLAPDPLPQRSEPMPSAALVTPTVSPLLPPVQSDETVAATPIVATPIATTSIAATPVVATPLAATPIATTTPIAQATPTVLPDTSSIGPPIAPIVSRPVPHLPVEASAVPPSPAVAAPSAPNSIAASPEPMIAPAILPQSPLAPAAPPKSPGATSPRDEDTLPNPVSRREPTIALEIRPVQTAPAPTTPRIAPAAEVFADAIHRATRDDRGQATPDVTGLSAPSDVKTHAVAATADARHGALDLRQEQWPARMIERIDALRDAANANDTSIRLIPDALGKIDVSLKRDGDTVTVHFTAQQAETRQLLSEAAPKLAELAEARGLKLAQGGADTTGQHQQRQQPTTPVAAAPRSARADATDSSDTRIA